MKRTLLGVFCLALLMAWVAPSFAKDHSIAGYFRTRFIRADILQNKDRDPDTVVDQRVRFKWDMGLNEYVTVTYYGEVDIQYGDENFFTGRNQGGGLGGDSVNLESKNIYLSVKIPDTPVSAKVGLQGFGDPWNYSLHASDAAGVTLMGNFDMVAVTGQWFKLEEGSDGSTIGANTDENDIDLWHLQVNLTPMDALKLGLDGFWYNINGPAVQGFFAANPAFSDPDAHGDVYFVGLNAAYTLPALTVDGWFAYNFGEYDGFGTDLDISAFGASLGVSGSFGPVKAKIRAQWFSGDSDNDTDVEFWQPAAVGESFWNYDMNLMIFAADAYWTTYGQNGFALTDAVVQGDGLIAVMATAEFVPPTMKQAYLKGAVGYFTSTDGQDNGHKDDDLGFEVAARVGYKLAEVVDLSLNGSAAFLGDYYAGIAANGDDPDTQYFTYFMVNVGF